MKDKSEFSDDEWDIWEQALEEGWVDGYEEAKEEFYDEGYEDGYKDALFEDGFGTGSVKDE